jgi:spermidine/putrescine-binding protein
MHRISIGLIGLALSLLLAGCLGNESSSDPMPLPEIPASATGTDAGGESGAPGEHPGPGPVTSKELNLYGWSEYVPQELLDAFSDEYGVTVNYDSYSSNEELLARMQAGASGYDVIIPSDYMVTVMSQQDMLEPIDINRLPNFANIESRFQSPDFDPGNRYTVPYQWGTVGIAVNTDVVEQPVTGWADLWDPAFENRLVMVDDEREVIGLALLMLGLDRNTTSQSDLDAAKQKLLELRPNIKLYDSDSPKTALLAGDVDAGVVWNGEAALAHRENPAIDYVLPAEGCGLWFDNLAIPAKPPHRDAAEAFLDFVMRPEMAMLISRDYPYSNPNQAALELMATEDPAAYETYMGFAATNPPADAIAKCQPIRDVGDALPLWDRVWTEIKGG